MAEKKQRKKKPTLKDQISELNSQVNDEKDIFCEFLYQSNIKNW